MNIDLLCGHDTMLHCGCKVCAWNEAIEAAAQNLGFGNCQCEITLDQDGVEHLFEENAKAIRALKKPAPGEGEKK